MKTFQAINFCREAKKMISQSTMKDKREGVKDEKLIDKLGFP